MTKPIGAVGSNDERLASVNKKKFFEKKNTEGAGAFVAQHVNISKEDFTRTGTVPGWNAGNVPMKNT